MIVNPRERRKKLTTNITNLTNNSGKLDYCDFLWVFAHDLSSGDTHTAGVPFVRFVLFVVKTVSSMLDIDGGLKLRGRGIGRYRSHDRCPDPSGRD